LTDLSQNLIEELGRITGIFLVWFFHSKLSGLTLIEKFFQVRVSGRSNLVTLAELGSQACIYMYIICLSVWVSVCLCPINVKTAEPIGAKLFLGPQGSSIDDQIFKNLPPSKKVVTPTNC